MIAALRGARAAVVFLTRVPVPAFDYRDDDGRWAAAWFPAVGLGIGAVLAAIPWVGEGRFSAEVLAWAVVLASLLLTGAFHEDGLADSADGLGGGYTPERVLEILKDSRIGAFGAVALVSVVGLRVALLASLGPRMALALVLGQALSRLPPVVMMGALPYATPTGSSKSRDVARAGSVPIALAGVTGLVVVAVAVATSAISGGEAAAIGLGLFGLTGVLGWRFHARVGGITGDFLGATQQLCELVVLGVLAAR